MKTGGSTGASTFEGLNSESKIDFQKLLGKIQGCRVDKISEKAGMGVFVEGELVARCFKKHDFYRFLEESKVDWQKILSERVMPDDAVLVIARKTIYIIEVKSRQVDDSVYEELMLCDFKRKQYLKLVAPLGLKVEYVYVLNDWFKKPEYKDVLDYIHSVNCHYKFNVLPLSWLGLPTRKP